MNSAVAEGRWREWIRFRTDHPGIRMFVIDSGDGIGVILRDVPPGPILPRISDDELTLCNFFKHRKEWLDLMSPLTAKRLYCSFNRSR